VAGPVVGGGGGGVSLHFEPPIEFILQQSGAFRRKLDDLTTLWDLFKPIMSQQEENIFDSYDWGAWPALADSTRARRDDQPILVQTSALKQSLIDPGQAATTGPKQMIWGTDVAYAEYHQDGGSTPGRPPQRKVIDVRVEDRQEFEAAMVGWINAAAAETWGSI
jgi:phage gpG-like protein